MLTEINPKLPMRDKVVTKDYYVNKLGFQFFGDNDFDGYLMVHKDNIQIHFFEFKDLDPKENYGQVYIRTNDIDKLYQTLLDRVLNENKIWRSVKTAAANNRLYEREFCASMKVK